MDTSPRWIYLEKAWENAAHELGKKWPTKNMTITGISSNTVATVANGALTLENVGGGRDKE